MVPMPVPQYGYPYGYPMAMLQLTSPRVGHLLTNGQLQMVSMPVPQYGYPYGYPMVMLQLTSPGVGHLQMSVISRSSAGPVAYDQSSSIQGTNSMLYVSFIFAFMCCAVYCFLLLMIDYINDAYVCDQCEFPCLWHCWTAHDIMYSVSLEGYWIFHYSCAICVMLHV